MTSRAILKSKRIIGAVFFSVMLLGSSVFSTGCNDGTGPIVSDASDMVPSGGHIHTKGTTILSGDDDTYTCIVESGDCTHPDYNPNTEAFNHYALTTYKTSPTNYVVSSLNRNSSYIFAAPHGGSIEGGTTEVAFACAGNNYDYYTFEGKGSGQKVLHVTSDNFNEPTGNSLIGASTRAIVLHGCDNQSLYYGTNSGTAENKNGYTNATYKVAYVGGRNTTLRDKVISKLREAGFCAIVAGGDLAGTSTKSFTNRTSVNSGCQIEMSLSLRNALFTGDCTTSAGRTNTTARFTTFCNALRAAIAY